MIWRLDRIWGSPLPSFFFLHKITKAKYNCSFEGIPNSSEKLLSLTITPPNEAHPIRVIDSLQFMMGSLSSVVENQKKEMKTKEEGFPRFCQVFRSYGYDDETISFLLKKNEFPNMWVARLLWETPLAYTVHATQHTNRLQEASHHNSVAVPPCLPPVWWSATGWCVWVLLQEHIKHTHNVNPLFFYGAPGLSPSVQCFTSSGTVMCTLWC